MLALMDVAELLTEGMVCAGHSRGEQGEEGALAAPCGCSREGFLTRCSFERHLKGAERDGKRGWASKTEMWGPK